MGGSAQGSVGLLASALQGNKKQQGQGDDQMVQLSKAIQRLTGAPLTPPQSGAAPDELIQQIIQSMQGGS